MRPLKLPEHPDLIVGRDARDDALVWRRPSGRALVATVDVFTPVVDDAATWGRIAATNAASDVFAMGAEPLFALAIAGWPREHLPLATLTAVLEAGQQAALDDGWIVAGGHTLDTPEPLYGQAVIGEVALDDLVTNSGGQPGDLLVVTKPIGTGIITTAVKAAAPHAVEPGGELEGAYADAVASMTASNRRAADILKFHAVTAMTDVTGFGVIGHLSSLADASRVGAELWVDDLPVLRDVHRLLAAGHIPGGTRRNLADVAQRLDVANLDEDRQLLVADAQTSGGLLAALPASRAAEAIDDLVDAGVRAAVVGRLLAATPGFVRLVG